MWILVYKWVYDKLIEMMFAFSNNLDQSGHSRRLVGVFTVRMKKPCSNNFSFSTGWWIWSDYIDSYIDLSLHWHSLYLLNLSYSGLFNFPVNI